MKRWLLLFCSLPVAVAALEKLSAQDFDDYSRGHTLYFAQNGSPYGVEQYFDNHKSIWKYADGTCAKGVWWEERDLICFVYDSDPEPSCWSFHKDGDKYSARVEDGDPANELVVVGINNDPITCRGPDVGV